MPGGGRVQVFASKTFTQFSAVALVLAILTAPLGAGAQPAAKVYRIGYVRAEAPPAVDIEAFRDGLRAHGYVEGTNVAIEYRWADGNEERLRSLVAELLRLKVDLIVTSAPAATRVAKEATTTIPIVMVLVADPVSFGFVASLARPGGNITGFAFLLPEISGKRLELLKEAVPELSRVAVLWNAANPYKPVDLREVQAVADALRVKIDTFPVRESHDFDDAFKAAVASRSGGLITLEDPFTIAHRKRIVGLALRHRLPAVYAVRPFVDAGGLMSYGPDRADQNRRAAASRWARLTAACERSAPVTRNPSARSPSACVPMPTAASSTVRAPAPQCWLISDANAVPCRATLASQFS